MTSTRGSAMLIGNSSTTSTDTGIFTLAGVTINSVDNVIARNANIRVLTIQNTQASGSSTMGLALGNAVDNLVSIDADGDVNISSIISGSGRNLTRSGIGAGALNLTGVNTYSGNTTIRGGSLALLTGGSIASSPTIDIGAAGIFDVQSLTTALILSSGQTLRASGTTTTGLIATSGTKGLTTAPNSQIQFTAFNSTIAPLTV